MVASTFGRMFQYHGTLSSNPALSLPPDRRGEEAGLSLRADREAERRHREDGDALEVQHDAAGGADAPLLIEAGSRARG